MKRRMALAAAAATLCFPAGALAAPSRGVVLSVNARHRVLQVIDGRHVVHAYHFHGRLTGVGTGSRVRFRRSGQTLRHVVASPKHVRTVSFLGRVIRSGSRSVVLRLADRKIFRLNAKAMHSAAIAAGGHQLEQGEVVLVTITLGPNGRQRVTVKPTGSDETGQPEAIGYVIELDPGTLVLHATDGSEPRFAVDPATLAKLQLSLCDTVAVSYHRAGATLIADDVRPTDAGGSDSCGNIGNSQGGSDASNQDVVGTIAMLSLAGLTITTADQRTLTFSADSLDLTAGFLIGDNVDVTYAQNDDGTLVADDIEYQDIDAVGSVTYVDNGSVTLVDSTTSEIRTFTDDPANESFDGVSVGDQIDVSYHMTLGRVVVDSVSDLTSQS